MVSFFGLILFLSQSCSISFVVLPLVMSICYSWGSVVIWVWYLGHSLQDSWGRIELSSLFPLIFLLLGTPLVGCGICLDCIPMTRPRGSSGESLDGWVGPIVLVCLASLWWASKVVQGTFLVWSWGSLGVINMSLNLMIFLSSFVIMGFKILTQPSYIVLLASSKSAGWLSTILLILGMIMSGP